MSVLSVLGTGVKRLLGIAAAPEESGRRRIDTRSAMAAATTLTAYRETAIKIAEDMADVYPRLSPKQRKIFMAARPELMLEIERMRDTVRVFDV